MLDIRPYIATLEVQFKEQLDDLMRIQIREYIEFIKSFTEAANIMTKNFFVVVPYSSNAVSAGSVSKLLPFGNKKPFDGGGEQIVRGAGDTARAAHFHRAAGARAHRRAHGAARHRRGDRASLQTVQPGRRRKADVTSAATISMALIDLLPFGKKKAASAGSASRVAGRRSTRPASSTCRTSSRRTRSRYLHARSTSARRSPARSSSSPIRASSRRLVRSHHQPRQSARHFDLHPPDGYQRNAPQVPEEGRRGAEPDNDARRKGNGARPDARHRILRPGTAARFPAAGAGTHL